ncbi:helix-turn-helix domain-containing protein, partial [Kineococcus glutinatus]|uniref:helix-turn-helix domain-containing protein n=1 Tax=Kineococcus glutinatus TaxID=1070872 RepID=UPI0031E5A837
MRDAPATPTTALLRRLNAGAVLDALRGARAPGSGAVGGAMTGTEVMAATGLSRPTVHTVCDALIDLGWVREAAGGEETARPGRPARRYAFDARAGYVLGVDLGAHKVTVVLADLVGTA